MASLGALSANAFMDDQPMTMVRPDWWEPKEMVSKTICNRAANRLLNQNQDFNEIIAAFNSNGERYLDTTFAFPGSI